MLDEVFSSLQATCYNLMKNTEGFKRHALDRDYEFSSEILNLVQKLSSTHQDQIPDSEVLPIFQEEYLNFPQVQVRQKT